MLIVSRLAMMATIATGGHDGKLKIWNAENGLF